MVLIKKNPTGKGCWDIRGYTFEFHHSRPAINKLYRPITKVQLVSEFASWAAAILPSKIVNTIYRLTAFGAFEIDDNPTFSNVAFNQRPIIVSVPNGNRLTLNNKPVPEKFWLAPNQAAKGPARRLQWHPCHSCVAWYGNELPAEPVVVFSVERKRRSAEGMLANCEHEDDSPVDKKLKRMFTQEIQIQSIRDWSEWTC